MRRRPGTHLGHVSQCLLCLVGKLAEVPSVDDGADGDGWNDSEHDHCQFGGNVDHGGD